jgi:hypothetical protein
MVMMMMMMDVNGDDRLYDCISGKPGNLINHYSCNQQAKILSLFIGSSALLGWYVVSVDGSWVIVQRLCLN